MAVLGCGSADAGAGPLDQDAAELAAILETVELTYRVSSFADAGSADPEEFRRPFTPTATLGFVRDGQLVERTVDEYVQIRREMLQGGEVRSLEEWEVGGTTSLFGNVAQRWSWYAVRLNGEEELAERGVMSFQLMKIGGTWKVHSLTWQAGSAEHPLPADFPPLEGM
ncbi:MAG: hypothetical protein ACF8NJ_11095 [Phycisphaerales bacterium JB038]